MGSRAAVAVSLALAVCCSSAVAEARVVRIEITKVETPAPGYEKISGKAYGELDSRDPKNVLITDIQLAPKNARGQVEYVATFALIKPLDMTKASGVMMYSVVNRGSGLPAVSTDGHVSLVSGWQGDVLPTQINQTIQVPVAKNADGSSITGQLVARLVDQKGSTALIMIPRDRVTPYPPVTLDTTKATLISAASETPMGIKGGATTIAPADWAFATCDKAPFPGTPDPTHVCLKSGFDPARLYELTYVGKDPLVLGIGFAATRDVNSFFRYETKDDRGTANPIAGRIRWAISEGSSQSGTFIRAFIRLGFNQDEAGRIVWDGANPHIASRVIDMNRRFALPGGVAGLYELGMEAPLWWEDWNDAPRGRGKAGLLDRCRASHTCPKIMETFGSAEIYGLRASAMLVGTDAKADLPLPENVRRYFFSGVTHGGGSGGFSTTTGAVSIGCDLPANPAPSAPMRAALMKSFIAWVSQGTPMPPSKYPMLSDGTLVSNTRSAMGFPNIPGKPSPEHVQYPFVDYDLGPHFNYADASGVLKAIPRVKGELPLLVPKVDADGNEIAGVKSPLQMAPLGTYTGWNIRSNGPFKAQMCQTTSPQGGFIPFAKTKAERAASRDPRLSLEERYHTHEGYVQAVSTAAASLVSQGFLLQSDADAMVKQAQSSSVLVADKGFANLLDHIHLGVPDQVKGAQWYHDHFDGQFTPEGTDRVMFGTSRLLFQMNAAPKPSEGSVLASIGFSVPDVDAKIRELQAAGVTVTTQPTTMGGIHYAQIVDPWGTTIDVVQDSEKLGLHHVHLVASDPDALLDWFAESFGSRVASYRDVVQGINYGGVWVLATEGASLPSQGHAIDHIGFRPANVDAAAEAMKARNVKVVTEPRDLTLASGTKMRLAFIEGPGGVRIEMVQRDNVK